MPQQQQPPIGYWLKRADELLGARIDAVQRANGLTRLDWQMLKVVRERGVAADADVARALQPFADAPTVDVALETLVARGLLRRRGAGLCELTDEGGKLYERALASQKAFRSRAFAGVSEADYATTVSVLRRLVENLEHTGERDASHSQTHQPAVLRPDDDPPRRNGG